MRVAVIEDNSDVADIVGIMVTDATTRVAAACSTAAEGHRLDWSIIDAAIIDRRLADGLADDLIRWIGRAYPHVTVVLLTSDPYYVVPDDLRDLWMQKPAHVDDLRDRLHGG